MILRSQQMIIRLALALAVLSAAISGAHAQDRIGFSEEFDSVDGWSNTERFEKVSTDNGIGCWDTWIGSISSTKFEGQPFSLPATTKTTRTYEAEVDFDRYPYLVIKLDQRPGLAEIEINGRESHAFHTSGIIAQDLRQIGLSGKAALKITMQFMNTGGTFKVDYIRLVSELSDAEKGNLIAAPVDIYKEELKAHPYQGLDALWRRAARPAPQGELEEWAVFHDSATAMPIWRMTARPSHEGLKGANQPTVWWPDGSIMNAPGRGFHFDKQAWGDRKVYHGRYRIDTGRETVSFQMRDESGEWKTIHTTPRIECHSVETGIAEARGRMVVAFIGKHALVVDAPKTADGKPDVKTIALPPSTCKGGGISADGSIFSYNTPWGSYNKINVLLDEDRWDYGAIHTFTHGMHGDPISIMSYTGNAKAVINDGADPLRPGKDVRLLAVYNSSAATDYGQMTRDCRYGITNGMRGELGGQYLMFSADDPGTILRVCTYNTSYSTWDTRAKVKASPDYTKLAYASDMMGWANYYLAIMRLPDAPGDLSLQGNKLTWTRPQRGEEIGGYHVYRNRDSQFERLTDKPVSDEAFELPEGSPALAEYAVASVERSGLTSVPSATAASGEVKTRTFHIEAENLPSTPPMRELADGQASNLRAMRVTPVRDSETLGALKVPAKLTTAGPLRLWARVKLTRGDEGSITVTEGENRSSAVVTSNDWRWVALGTVEGDEIILSSSDAGLAIDKLILSSKSGYVPKTADDRLPPPAAPKALAAKADPPHRVALSWSEPAEGDPAWYSIYVGESEDIEPSNATLVGSTRATTFTDRGLTPGQTYYYTVVACDAWGNSSEAAKAVSAKLPALERKVIEVTLDNAKLDEGLEVIAPPAADGTTKPEGGRTFVSAPKNAAKGADMTVPLEVPADGVWYIWVAARNPSDRNRITAHLDGKDIGRVQMPISKQKRTHIYRFQTQPYHQPAADAYQLSAGKHDLKLVFESPGSAAEIGGFWLTNDPSFTPPGYNPQPMFKDMPDWPGGGKTARP
jgi:hypothetical protein